MLKKVKNKLGFSVADYFKLLLIIPVVYLFFHYFSRQSWGYFTTDPKQPILNAYNVRGKEVETTPLLKNISSYDFGISRDSRYLYKQLFNIVLQKKDEKWHPFNPDSLQSFIHIKPFIEIDLEGNEKGLKKGRYVFVSTIRKGDSIINGQLSLLQKQYFLLVELR